MFSQSLRPIYKLLGFNNNYDQYTQFSCLSKQAPPPPPVRLEAPVEEAVPEPSEPAPPSNTLPVIDVAEFVNDNPTAQDKVQVRVEASDADNERVRLDYEWVVNGKKLTKRTSKCAWRQSSQEG